MACHINRFSSIVDFKSICSSLGLGLHSGMESTQCSTVIESKHVEQDLDGWNNNWEWNMDTSESHEQQHVNGTWPSPNCFVSLSSFADTLVVAQGQEALFLTSKWGMENDEEKLRFSVSSSKKLTSEPNESVTSVLCIPLASQRRSQPTGPDWTSIAIGFSTGFLRFYTHEGELLVSQCLREGPVWKILYQNNASSQSDSSLGDLVAICGDSCIITIDAFTLLQTVRACRSHLARAKAGQSPMLQPPTLVYKKWILQDVLELSDCCLLGTNATNPFDQLVWDSFRGGPSSHPKTIPPTANILLSTGLNFFLGSFHFTESGGQLNLSDVMGAVTSKLKSALIPQSVAGKFNLWSRSASSEEPIPTEPPVTVSMRYGFYDKRRKGLSLLLSPNGKLAVLTDSFGRVVLLDVPRGICTRMWKGYRDAQCGWIESEEETKKSKKAARKALFLIIYAPRRGILEIWSAPDVYRIAAFTVSKSALLLCPGYSVMGSSMKDLPKSLLYPCCLLEPDGSIATIHIPFSTALKSARSCPQKDVYLLTDLQQILRERKDNLNLEVQNLFVNIHSTLVLKKALDLILSEDNLVCKFLQDCLSSFLDNRTSGGPSDTSDSLQAMSRRLLNLLTMYDSLDDLNQNPAALDCKKVQELDDQLLSDALGLTEDEVKLMSEMMCLHIQCCSSTLVSSASDRKLKRVTFQPPENSSQLSCRDMLKVFDWACDDTSQATPFSHSLNEDKKSLLCSFIFRSALVDSEKVPTLNKILMYSPIKTQDIMELLLHHWLSRKDANDRKLWINFFKLMESITNKDTLNWEQILNILSVSTNIPGAFVACVLLRTLISQRAEDSPCQSNKSDASEWETLTEEHVRWSLLQRRLEDLLILDALLRSKGPHHVQPVSVQLLLEKGQGSVSEVIAKWIVSSNSEDVLELLAATQSGSDNMTQVEESPDRTLLKDLWSRVCERFPRSLDGDSIQANCCWEQMILWSKEPDDISRLKYALAALSPLQSAILKNGTACMMWKTFVVNRFEALAVLMEKVGKTPKERLCKQDLSMSAMYLEPFLDFCCQLLELIIEANVVSDVESFPQFPPEDMWRESSSVSTSGTSTPISSSSGCLPLVVLACNQNPSNYFLLYHHHMLASALLLVITFGLKNMRPLSFYDLKGRQAFFHELQGSYVVPQTSLPFKVMMGRTHFLQKVTCAIAHSLPDPLPASQFSDQHPEDIISSTEERRKSEQEASRWLNRTLELAKGWDISLDELRRHYVCQLYSCGQDSLAEECLNSVSDYLCLGSQLLLIAGQRVASVLQESGQDEVSRMAYLPPSLSQWLKALHLSELRNPMSSLTATKQLLGHAINLTSEDSLDNKRALALLDAIVTEKVVFPS